MARGDGSKVTQANRGSYHSRLPKGHKSRIWRARELKAARRRLRRR